MNRNTTINRRSRFNLVIGAVISSRIFSFSFECGLSVASCRVAALTAYSPRPVDSTCSPELNAEQSIAVRNASRGTMHCVGLMCVLTADLICLNTRTPTPDIVDTSVRVASLSHTSYILYAHTDRERGENTGYLASGTSRSRAQYIRVLYCRTQRRPQERRSAHTQ